MSSPTQADWIALAVTAVAAVVVFVAVFTVLHHLLGSDFGLLLGVILASILGALGAPWAVVRFLGAGSRAAGGAGRSVAAGH